MKKILFCLVLIVLALSARSQAKYAVGQDIEVYDPIEKNWFASTILNSEGNRYFIHYKGYSEQYDVWVEEPRMRRVGEKKASPIFYLIGSTEDLYTYYVREKVDILYLTPDSAAFQSGPDPYSFNKLPGKDYLTAKQKIYESNLYLEYVDENSFLLSRSHNKLSYYHRDKALGAKFMKSPELGLRVDSALAHIKRDESNKYATETQKKNEKEYNTVTKFTTTFTSKKNDPTLTADITQWWNGDGKVVNPLLKIYVINRDYAVKRNEFGIILHKYVSVLLAYKTGSNGKCHVQWHNFGYDNTGGSTYSTELKIYQLADVYFSMNGMTLYPGKVYDCGCEAIK